MTTNRDRVDNTIIKKPAVTLERGLLPGFQGKYVVDEGWVAVVTEGGAYRETLQPGHHSLGRYKYRRDIRMTNVNTKIQTVSVITSDEFKIQQSVAGQMPLIFDVDLSLSIEYQVSDPLRVAMEIERPVTALFDRVIQAARDGVSYVGINEVRAGGGIIARTIQQNLQGMNLPKTIGMEVLGVFVTSIQATDSGEDALARTAWENFSAINEWQRDAYMTQNSQVTWEWLLINQPQIAQQYIAQYGDLAKTMIEKGMLNTAGFLNAPPGSIPSVSTPGMGNIFSGFPGLPGPPTAQGQLSAGAGVAPADPHARMRQEKEYLEKIDGAKVDMKAGMDSHQTPDGSYMVRLMMPRTSGGLIQVFFDCSPRYPLEAPDVTVLVDDQPTQFQSAALRGWRGGEYLVEVARDVRNYFS